MVAGRPLATAALRYTQQLATAEVQPSIHHRNNNRHWTRIYDCFPDTALSRTYLRDNQSLGIIAEIAYGLKD